ncbi:MAG: PCMD domain-containing protein [Alistipes sp.]|nr:PCMD domain-containing protein [Alistipes sp.]
MTKRLAIILFSALALASCIKNDVPRPVVDLFIASLDVEGTDGEIVLDRSSYTATVPLAEATNIEAVQFNSITYGADVVTNINYTADDSKIVVSKDLNNKVVNMSQPEYITLSYFQTFEWKIVATQTINRIWTVDGQIGATEWDIEGHRAIVKRRQDYPLNDVKTTDVRFGPRPTYDFPEASEMPTDFDNAEKSRTITVAAHGRSTIWELIIEPTEVALDFEYVSAGANVIWIKAANIDGATIQFAYRKRGSEEWLKVKDEWYAADSKNPYNRYEEGFVKAVVRGLEPSTEYEVIGYADEKQSDIKIVATTSLYQLPNSQMEEWAKFTNDQNLLPTGEAGPCWYPFSSVQNMFWATGNPGGTSLGEKYNLTYPVYKSANPENVPPGSTGDISAFMGSQSVLNMKFAAGNLFVGHYGETLGTNAKIYFGRKIDQNVKPVALRFKVKYSRGNINWITINNKYQSASTGTEYHIGSKQIKIIGGQPDVAKVFLCLTDWTEPHCVNSADEKTFFDPRTAAGVFGLGYFDSDSTPELVVANTDEWHTMTIPIEYSNPEIVPSVLLLTFTCSGYGDYFTGSSESWMYVDDIELLYDLDEENQPK